MRFGEAELRLLNSVGASHAKLIGAEMQRSSHFMFPVCFFLGQSVSSLDRDFCRKDSLPCLFSVLWLLSYVNCNQSTRVQLQHNAMDWANIDADYLYLNLIGRSE